MRPGIRISIFFLFIPVICLIALASCKKESPYSLNLEYYYYPVDSGHYVIYDVDSIQYTDNPPVATIDTVRYQWMEVVGDTFHDNQNRTRYYLNYYRRPDSLSPWAYDRTWSAYISTVGTGNTSGTSNLQIDEDDLNFVKLPFPPSANESWNGNIYLPTTDQYSVFMNWNYFIENIDTTFRINGLTLNNSIIVSEVNQVNLLTDLLRTEAYAPNIGMIYQQWDYLTEEIVDSNYTNGSLNGYRIRMWMHSYHP